MLLAMHACAVFLSMVPAPLPLGLVSEVPGELERLKEGFAASDEELKACLGATASPAERAKALDRHRAKVGALARRGLAFAEARLGSGVALEALILIIKEGAEDERNVACGLLAKGYLDQDALLPFIRTAWGAGGNASPHIGALLRAAAERSPNTKVRSLATYSLGRHLQDLALWAQALDHPVRGEALQEWIGPEKVRRLRSLDPEGLQREAEALFERTAREFADSRPLGEEFPRLGEQAEGALFRLRHLQIGRVAPEIEGEDIDGRPMRLSEFRGKVVVLTFWATWCAPCMGLVPGEKALVERMRGRPFALIGVNGDNDRARAMAIAAKEEINWRSFWEGGWQVGTPVRWSIDGWPTVYLIDDKGVIRDDMLVGHALDETVEALVSKVEAASVRHD